MTAKKVNQKIQIFFLLHYNDENYFFDKLSNPCYQSTPGVFESAASKPLLHKNDNVSTLYWFPNIKSLPSAPQEMFIKPLSFIPELKSSVSLSEKSHSQIVGLCKTQSALFQCDVDNEPFLPIGKIKYFSALDLTEKAGSSNIIYPPEVSPSDSLLSQDLKQQTFVEVADSSNYILEGLQGKAESDIYSLGDDIECCSLDENVCSERSTELQREICDQGDLTGECFELADLENLFDDLEIYDTSLPLQSALQLPSKEEPVGYSDMDINQCFPYALLPSVPHEQTRELEYHPSDLRMLRVSPETVPKTCKHLSGDISKGDINEITQSNLKADITTTSGDSGIGSHLPLSSEDFSQLAVRSSVENTIGLHTDILNQQILANGHVTEETLNVLAVSELADQKTGISTIPFSSYSLRERLIKQQPPFLTHFVFSQPPPTDSLLTKQALKVPFVPGPVDHATVIPTVSSTFYAHGEKPLIFCQQTLPESHLTEQALKVSAAPGSTEQKTSVPIVSSTYSHREKPSIFYQQELSECQLPEQSQQAAAASGFDDQKTGIPRGACPYSHREKPGIFYQQELPESHLTEQSQRAAAASGFADQKTGIPRSTSTSYSHREKRGIFYQQELPESHLTEQSQQAAAASGFADQKTGIPRGTSTSYSHREKRGIFYQQKLPESHLTEQSQQAAAASGFAEQKTGIPRGTSTSYSHREKPGIFYQQELPENLLTEQSQQSAAASGFAEQKTGLPTAPYSHREKPGIFYQQELPENLLTEQSQQAAAASGFADQKTGLPTAPYSHREKPGIFYQQELPESHLTEQSQQAAAASGFADQKTGIPTAPYSPREYTHIFYQQTLPENLLTEQSQQAAAASGFADQKTGLPTAPYSHREKPSIFYQELPESLLTEQSQQAAAASGFADQKTGIPRGTSTSYSHREKPGIFYQQELPENLLTEQSQQAAAASGFAEQKTGLPTAPYSHREKPGIFYQQELPENLLTEQSQQAAAASGFADQKTGLPTAPYSNREKRGIFYQQELPESHLTEQSQQAAAASGFADQKTGIPTAPYSPREYTHIFYQQTLPENLLTEQSQQAAAASGFADQKTGLPTAPYSHREKPSIFYQQELPESLLTEQSQQAAAVSGFADQKTGLSTAPYSHREKPGIFYQQELPESLLTEQSQQAAAVSGFAEQKIPTGTSTSYSHREKPHIFHQQTLPESHLTEEALKVSAAPGSTEQKTGIPIVSSTYSHGEKPSTFYQQELPESHLTEQSQQVVAVSEFTDQTTGIPTGTSASYSHGEKPHTFYQQTLSESHLTEQALKDSAAPGLAAQKSVVPILTSASYSHREKPNITFQQELPVSHLTKEAQKVPAIPVLAQQKTGIPIAPPTSGSPRGKTSVFYQQKLPGSHLTEQAQRLSSIPGPADENTGIQIVPSSASSNREKPIFYQQDFPDSHLTEKALKVASVLRPAEQNTGIPSGSSGFYPCEEKPSIFYQPALLDSHLTEESLKVSSISRLGDQKTGILTVPSSSNSHREKPNIFYQQELPDGHLTEQPQKVLTVPEPAEQKTGIPRVTPTSYSQREKPFIFYPQGFPDSHLPEESLTGTAVPALADQKTGLPPGPSSSYSHREKPIIFYPQALPDTHLTEEALKVSTISGPADEKPEIRTLTSTSYPHIEKHIISPQALPDHHLLEEALKVLTVSGPADQKTGLPSEPTSYSHREKPIFSYPQGLTESHLSEEALKVLAVPGPADQKTVLPLEPSSFYSPGEKPSVFYQQELPDSHLTEEALKVSAVPGTGDQKTGIPTIPASSYSLGEKSVIFYPEALPDRHLTEEALNVPTSPVPADQKTGSPTVSSTSSSHREKPFILYPQALPDGQRAEEALKVLAVPLPGDQNTGLPAVSSTSYSSKEKPIVFYPQALPDSLLTVEALKVSAVPEPGDQDTRKPTAVSAAYSQKEKPIISYQQELPSIHRTEEALKLAGIADWKTGIPTGPSISYSYRQEPIISYQQDLTKEALELLGVSEPADQKTGISVLTSTSYSPEVKPIISYQQELPDRNEDASKLLAVPGPVDQKTGIRIVPFSSYSHREGPIFYQRKFSDITEKTLEVSAVPGPTDQKTGIGIIPSGPSSYSEKGNILYQQALPDTTEEAIKVFALPGPADQKTEIPAEPSSSYLHKEKPRTSTVILPDDQKTELPTAPLISYSHREKPKNLTVIGPDDQQSPLLTVFRNSNSQKVKPSIIFKQHLPGRHSEDILKISSVRESTDVNSGVPIPLSSSYSQREKSNIVPQELPDRHLTEDILTVSTIPEPVDQKTVLPTALPRFFSHREKPNKFYQQDLPDRRLTTDGLKFSSGLDQGTGLSAVHPDTYLHSEKHKLVSDRVQRLVDKMDSSNSSISNNMPLNSQADGRVVINKPEPSSFEDTGSEEFQGTDNDSKTLKEIRTLLMEAENIALKRCNFPAPLLPFRDVNDISCVQSKKVVCFKEPPTTDESNIDLPQRQPFTEENPNNKCIQKDISTRTNLKCQRGIENWEFISSTTVRSPLQEVESQARMAIDETLRRYKATRSVMRSEPEVCSGTTGNKILIPMMTIIKSDSSSDVSSCSWDSNSFESVSDVLLNLFPCTSPKTSMTESREEEGVSESDDGGGSSVDSLGAHVKNLLKCESSLNHAKQILRNAEEEECRVRARAWNLKFNMARECGYPISELNEDDRRKVEEIKAKLFVHERTDVSKGLRSPRGIGCQPEAVCSHIIIESHEKGCFRTLTPKQPQLDSHPCVFRSAEPLEIIRGHRNPSSWRARHINLSKSLDQSNTHFKVWDSLQLQRHSPVQNCTADDFRISKGLRMPFRGNMDPWLSELVEPTCVLPEEMDCHSSSQVLSPESMKKFTTSITFSSHRHSKCFSDSSVLKVGVTEDSQCTGASVGVFNSQFTEEQSPPRDLKQNTSSPSSFRIISHSPDKAVTILAEGSRQGQNVCVKHSHQQEKRLIERADSKDSNSEPSTSTNCNKFKEVHFSDKHTLISMGRASSILGVKEKNVIVTPNSPPILLEQDLFEESKVPHADHYVRKPQSPPPQHQHYVAANSPCHIFLEKREPFEQSKTPHVDHQMRENHSSLTQGQSHIAPDLPSSIFLEQRQLFEQSKGPDVDHHLRKQYSPPPQGRGRVVGKSDQHKPKSDISSMINVETNKSAPNQYTLVTSPSSPPSNRRVLSCVRITLSPKTPSKLDSGTLDERFLSLDPASNTRMNSEFNSDLQTISSRSLEPTSKLLTCKPVAHDQLSLGFPGPKSSPDSQVIQSLPDSNTRTQDLKTIPFQNSQIVTSRQTQVNISDLEEYFNPEGTPVSADRSLKAIKPSFPAISEKSLSDAVTQITTKSPGKAMFSSEIFINAEVREREIPEASSQKLSLKFAPSSSVQKITAPRGKSEAQLSVLPYKPSGSTRMYYVPQFRQIPSGLDSKSDTTTIESSHSGSNDAIAPDFPAQVLGTRDDDLKVPVNIKHKEGIYSKRAKTEASLSKGRKKFQKDIADAEVEGFITGNENVPFLEEREFLQEDNRDSSTALAAKLTALLQGTKMESQPDTKAIKQKGEVQSKSTLPNWLEDKSFQIDTGDSSTALAAKLSPVLQGTKMESRPDTKAIKQKGEVQSKSTLPNWLEDKSFQIDTEDSGTALAAKLSAVLQGTKTESRPDTKAIKQKGEVQSKSTLPNWLEDKSFQIDTEDSSTALAAKLSAVLQGTKVESRPDTKAIKQKGEVQSKSTLPNWLEDKSFQIDTGDSSTALAAKLSAVLQGTKVESRPDTKAIKQKGEVQSKSTLPNWSEDKSFQIDTGDSSTALVAKLSAVLQGTKTESRPDTKAIKQKGEVQSKSTLPNWLEDKSFQIDTEDSSTALVAKLSAVLQGTKVESRPDTKAIKQKGEVQSKSTLPNWLEDKSFQIDTEDSSTALAAKLSAVLQGTKVESRPDTKAIKQKGEVQSKSTLPNWSEDKSFQIDTEDSSTALVAKLSALLQGTKMESQPDTKAIKQKGEVQSKSTLPNWLEDKSFQIDTEDSSTALAAKLSAVLQGTKVESRPDTKAIKQKGEVQSKSTLPNWSEDKSFQIDTEDSSTALAAKLLALLQGTKMESRPDTKAIKQKGEVQSKSTLPNWLEDKSFQIDTEDSSTALAAKLSAVLQGTKVESRPDTKAIKQKGEVQSKSTLPNWSEDKSFQIDTGESRCLSEFENTTHSVFRTAKFYFHHPVHLPSDRDFCQESLGRRSAFMRHSCKDFFQDHPNKQNTCLPPSYQNKEKTMTDYTRIESLSINVNLENKEVIQPTKSQAEDYAKCVKQINDQKKDLTVNPESTTQHITSLNELWNKFQERQKQQKPLGFRGGKELSLVERLDRLAKLLQNPITHSLWPSESTQDESREQRDAKEWGSRQQQQRNKLQKKKRYKSWEKCHKSIGDLKKSKMLSTHQAGKSNQIKIEQVKFDKYILRKQPGFCYINNTSSDSRPSEESELLTDTATNILSTTSVESDVLTQTDKEVTLHERSSSLSTIDTARLVQAFGHERVCLSPRRVKVYSSTTDHQRRYIAKRSKNKKKALSSGYPQMTSEHTRRKRIQVVNQTISSDSVSSVSSFWSSRSTLCDKQNVHMLNKSVQAGNLEIVNGVKKHTRDVGMVFPSPSEVRVEEDSDVTSWSEEKVEEKRLLTSYLGDKKIRKNKQNCEVVSWFVPVENVKSGPTKENLSHRGPGVSWFAPITSTRPWREPLREQNWQGQHPGSRGPLAGPGRSPLTPLVKTTLQESLQLHRPDFISRSGERIKRLKLIVQERKLQNMFQSEREALFNTVRERQGQGDPMCPLPKRGFLTAPKCKPIGKKEMTQRSKRIYEQLPEVRQKREEEKRRLEYKSYRLRAQLYKKKVTNQLLGRKVPWD